MLALIAAIATLSIVGLISLLRPLLLSWLAATVCALRLLVRLSHACRAAVASRGLVEAWLAWVGAWRGAVSLCCRMRRIAGKTYLVESQVRHTAGTRSRHLEWRDTQSSGWR